MVHFVMFQNSFFELFMWFAGTHGFASYQNDPCSSLYLSGFNILADRCLSESSLLFIHKHFLLGKNEIFTQTDQKYMMGAFSKHFYANQTNRVQRKNPFSSTYPHIVNRSAHYRVRVSILLHISLTVSHMIKGLCRTF